VLVTHNPELARRAERVLQMQDGRLVGEQAEALAVRVDG
jgi:predicted ABC-type transport system involved in lysophospholipase L1 biosynthesis ATPase subunit